MPRHSIGQELLRPQDDRSPIARPLCAEGFLLCSSHTFWPVEPLRRNPDPKHISTSHVERLNWSLRTSNRRYTRLSNRFSRKLRNHEASVALNYFAYNFVRIHRTLSMSSAMAAGVKDRLWEVSDIVELLQQAESKKAA